MDSVGFRPAWEGIVSRWEKRWSLTSEPLYESCECWYDTCTCSPAETALTTRRGAVGALPVWSWRGRQKYGRRCARGCAARSVEVLCCCGMPHAPRQHPRRASLQLRTRFHTPLHAAVDRVACCSHGAAKARQPRAPSHCVYAPSPCALPRSTIINLPAHSCALSSQQWPAARAPRPWAVTPRCAQRSRYSNALCRACRHRSRPWRWLRRNAPCLRRGRAVPPPPRVEARVSAPLCSTAALLHCRGKPGNEACGVAQST